VREHSKGRKSVGSRPAASEAAGTVAGPLRASGRGICRWKAPRIGEAVLVDARACGSGSGALRALGNRQTRGATLGVRGRVADPTRGRKRRTREALPARGARLFLSTRRDVGRLGRSWRAPSSAASPEVGLLQGGPAPQSGWHWAHAWCASRRRSSRRELRARESIE
jgi:hypothetical protein